MRSLVLMPLIILCLIGTPAGAADAVEIVAVGPPDRPAPCDGAECRSRDAVFFIHGIYGDADTFRNGAFDWPAALPVSVEGRTIDVYRISFQTLLITWSMKDVTSLDELEEALNQALFGSPAGGLDGPPTDGVLMSANGTVTRPYRSLNFIAHSLGGNVAAALIHEIKSRYGHDLRARFGFAVTFGTPANGAQIASLGGLLKHVLGMPDPLLQSLAHDNTFLRMLKRWRLAEDLKAQRFRCRPVHLYVGVEGRQLAWGGIIRHTVVTRESAEEPVRRLAREIRFFEDEDHASIVKPDGPGHDVFRWVNEILAKEMRRLGEWRSAGDGGGALCDPPAPMQW
jgi:hypothetical protein